MEHFFYKYQGTGNDFVIIDNRNSDFDSSDNQLIADLCHRRKGIGADGLMLLENAEGYDFKMVYFNADGREGSLCGNGARCIVSFAKSLDLFDRQADFLAADGPHTAISNEDGSYIKLSMNEVSAVRQDGEAWVMDTGSPHYVKVVHDLDAFSVVEEGRRIRYNGNYPEGINVNFIALGATQEIRLRTYERGVEDETLACGTGATAAAMVAAHLENSQGSQQWTVHTQGGGLLIDFDRQVQGDRVQFREVRLSGPAQRVFEGKIRIV